MRAALAFLTPIGGARTPTARALAWFPVVGATIGAVVGASWWAAGEAWTPEVAAALAVVTDLALTGMLHVDGLGDSADGLLPHLPRERRLQVMRTPDIGAFGIAAIGGVLLLRYATLASLEPDVWLLAAVWALSRSLVVWSLVFEPYARGSGLATAFTGGSRAVGRLVPLVPLVVVVGTGHVAPAVAVVAASAGVALLARRRIGGYTGDVLGAAIILGETAGLLAAAA